MGIWGNRKINLFANRSRFVALTLSVILIVIAIGAYFTLSSKQSGQAAWYNSSWAYRKQLTTDPAKV
ncbi:MAG: hypothetical protein M1275_03945, partial [Patescibacteria group bacterium]|nr:hypothetical protein [Patescibacteria group bacterium]